MITCEKTYRDIPFAHRQHLHDGHCALVHGHNWSFTFVFGCDETDANGFVIDFGKLGFIKDWFGTHLDHACVLNEDDPRREALVGGAPEAWKIYLVPNCSCEGLAVHVYEQIDRLVREASGDRAFVKSVRVEEDTKNAATYCPEND